MRDYGSVYTCFWMNPEIQALSDKAKLLAVYLLTGPHTSMLGCFRLPMGYICEDLHWSVEQVTLALEALSNIAFATYDFDCHWVWVNQFLVWNPIENPNQGKKVARLLEQVPEHLIFFAALVKQFLKESKHIDIEFIARVKAHCHALETACSAKKDPDASPSKTKLAVSEKDISPSPSLPVITITLNNRSEFPITAEQVSDWQLLYPAIDVLQTLRHICAWNQANPTRRKTKSGILRHIVAWLSKEQNQSQQRSSKKAYPQTVSEHNRAVAADWLKRSELIIHSSNPVPEITHDPA